MIPRDFVLVEPMRRCPAPQVLEEVARVNGVINVLGVELSQLTNDQDRVGLHIAPSSTDRTGGDNRADAGDVRELFQTPTLRRATISMWVVQTRPCYWSAGGRSMVSAPGTVSIFEGEHASYERRHVYHLCSPSEGKALGNRSRRFAVSTTVALKTERTEYSRVSADGLSDLPNCFYELSLPCTDPV